MGLIVNPYRYATAGGAGYSGAYDTLTIASGTVGSNLTSYPVYVDLSTLSLAFWAGVDSAGAQVRVSSGDGNTAMPVDVVWINTGTNTGSMFFKANLLSASSNAFRIYYATGLSAPATGASDGRNAVWSAFDWIWLGYSASTFTDRTGGADGSLSGSVSASAIALGAGCGLDFVSAKIRFATRTARGTFTLGVTSQLDVGGNIASNYTSVSYGSSNTLRLSLGARNNGTTDSWNQWDNVNSWISADTGVAIVAAQSKRCHAVYSGATNRKFYANGAINTTSGAITARSTDVTYDVGATFAASEFFDGKIAFAYSRPEALSADYIAAEYSNLNAPASFYAIT